MEFLDRHLPEIVIVGIFIVSSIGGLMVWRFNSLAGQIVKLGNDFKEFRQTVYQKFDKGFDDHKEFEGRVSFMEGKTNGKPKG